MWVPSSSSPCKELPPGWLTCWQGSLLASLKASQCSRCQAKALLPSLLLLSMATANSAGMQLPPMLHQPGQQRFILGRKLILLARATPSLARLGFKLARVTTNPTPATIKILYIHTSIARYCNNAWHKPRSSQQMKLLRENYVAFICTGSCMDQVYQLQCRQKQIVAMDIWCILILTGSYTKCINCSTVRSRLYLWTSSLYHWGMHKLTSLCCDLVHHNYCIAVVQHAAIYIQTYKKVHQ
jgi:hypothetical protein